MLKLGVTTQEEKSMGKHGTGDMNENGELFADFCGLNGLVIGGTIFPHKEIHKTTWNSPDKRTKNQIDHITINSKWRTSLLDTRVLRGADIGSDHMLVVSRLRLKLRRVVKEFARRKLDLDKLKDPPVQREFSLRLQNRFEVLGEMDAQEEATGVGVEEIWQSVKSIYVETGKEVLGYSTRKRKEWISGNTWTLIEERKGIKNRMLSNTQHTLAEDLQEQYKAKNKAVKKSARQDKRNYIENKAKEAEEAAKVNDSRKLYNITRSLSCKSQQNSTTIKDLNGNILTTVEDQLNRWAEHFSEILNREEPRNPPQLEVNVPELDINSDPIRREEIRKAIKQLKNSKAPGCDDILAELLKADLETTSEVLFVLFSHIWQEEQIPDDWHRGLIVKIPKKGDTTRLYGIPQKIIGMIQALYRDFTCSDLHEGNLTPWFAVRIGVKQGCMLSPLLFLIALDWVMEEPTNHQRTGIRWKLTSVLEDLDYADDLCLLSSTGAHLSEKTARLSNNARKVGLKINSKKTKWMSTGCKRNRQIKVDGLGIEKIDQFSYLGSVIDVQGGADADVKARIGKARQAFTSLKPIWNSKKISLKTKLKLYNSNVKTVLLYGSESWKTTHEIVRKLRVFTHKCLRILLGIRWPQKITNLEVCNICKQEKVCSGPLRGKDSEVDPKQLGGGQQRKN